MFCSICREEGEESGITGGVGEVNAFVKGTTNFKLEAVKDHDISKCHRAACLKHRNKQKSVQETPCKYQ